MAEASQLEEVVRILRNQSEAIEALQEQIRTNRAQYDEDRQQWKKQQGRAKWVSLIFLVLAAVLLWWSTMTPRQCEIRFPEVPGALGFSDSQAGDPGL